MRKKRLSRIAPVPSPRRAGNDGAGATIQAALPGYLGAGAIQGAIAGYGAYMVGKAAQTYLSTGATWGQLGANTVMQEILDRVDDATIISRLREELLPTLVAENPTEQADT